MIISSCIGKHYYEAEDGVFHLFRGTNRNESLHKRIRHVWPEKLGKVLVLLCNYAKLKLILLIILLPIQLGERLADTILSSFLYQWNCKRRLAQFSPHMATPYAPVMGSSSSIAASSTQSPHSATPTESTMSIALASAPDMGPSSTSATESDVSLSTVGLAETTESTAVRVTTMASTSLLLSSLSIVSIPDLIDLSKLDTYPLVLVTSTAGFNPGIVSPLVISAKNPEYDTLVSKNNASRTGSSSHKASTSAAVPRIVIISEPQVGAKRPRIADIEQDHLQILNDIVVGASSTGSRLNWEILAGEFNDRTGASLTSRQAKNAHRNHLHQFSCLQLTASTSPHESNAQLQDTQQDSLPEIAAIAPSTSSSSTMSNSDNVVNPTAPTVQPLAIAHASFSLAEIDEATISLAVKGQTWTSDEIDLLLLFNTDATLRSRVINSGKSKTLDYAKFAAAFAWKARIAKLEGKDVYCRSKVQIEEKVNLLKKAGTWQKYA